MGPVRQRNLQTYTRADFLRTFGLGAAGLTLIGCGIKTRGARRLPNIIVIFADDLGYGDLGVFGHPTLRTSNLDRMAAEGMKLTQFYVAASVCTPSRAALLTGRYPIRSGMCSDKRRVLFPDSGGGLPASEITIAEALKSRGYATACIGKWHLGHLPQYLPTKHGFDTYYGLPYSNDMHNVERGDPPVPLMRNEDIIEQPVDQATLTERYTREAVQFIEDHRDEPFFLYFPHTFPHIPLFASADFKGKSLRGLYGDVVEEIDWSVGQILDTLQRLKLFASTLVLFTSDNGPWLTQDLEGGSAGLLRGGKGSTWDGGMREPTIAWWPGTIPAGMVNAGLSSTLDILPTCLALAGVALPTDRTLDGVNMLPMLRGAGPSQRDTMFFYRGTRLCAVRQGPWKVHFTTQAGYQDQPHEHDPPLLFHLEHDPSEKYNVASDHPEVLARIIKVVEAHQATIEPVENQLEIPLPG
ncbi:MAG: sulfatase [Candidatus Neomarinimicrobiota bacterium]